MMANQGPVTTASPISVYNNTSSVKEMKVLVSYARAVRLWYEARYMNVRTNSIMDKIVSFRYPLARSRGTYN